VSFVPAAIAVIVDATPDNLIRASLHERSLHRASAQSHVRLTVPQAPWAFREFILMFPELQSAAANARALCFAVMGFAFGNAYAQRLCQRSSSIVSAEADFL